MRIDFDPDWMRIECERIYECVVGATNSGGIMEENPIC